MVHARTTFRGSFLYLFPRNILHISFRSARSAEESARSVPSLSDSPGFFLPDGFPLPQKVLLQKFPDALPGILPDRSFCETAVFPGIIMGMIYSRICRIDNWIAFLNHCSGTDHIFIENRPLCKTACFLINPFIIGRTHIRTEIGLDPVLINISQRLYRGLLRIIKRTSVASWFPIIMFSPPESRRTRLPWKPHRMNR